MATLTPTAIAEQHMGPASERSGSLDDHTVDWVTIHQDSDLTELLKGLPEDRCQCPHWGVVSTGRLTVRYADRTEVVEAGDAFYMAPGHVPSAEAGTTFVQFSPTAEYRTTLEAIQANAQRLASA